MNQDFQPPTPPPGTDERRRSAQARVATPAGCLVILSVLALLGHIGSLGRIATMREVVVVDKDDPGEVISRTFSGPTGAGVSGVSLLISCAMLYGSWQMWNLKQWGWSMAAAILTAVPCISPCCCFSTPFGIWAILVLNDAAVRSEFR